LSAVPNPSGPVSTAELITELISLVLRDPQEGQRIAEEFGLWDEVKEAIEKPLRLSLCYDDVNAFIEYAIEDPETGLPAEQQDFHIEWQDMISKEKRVEIVAPRGHGKTIQVAARVVWEIGRNHNIRVKIIGSSDDKAKEILGLVRNMIKNSPKVQEVFPGIEIDEDRGDTQGSFFVKRSNVTMRDPTCQASGVLSAGAGGRADLLVCDDVVDMKNAIINPSMREQVIRTVKETWFSLVSASGRIVWIATPYHLLDATHDLRDNAGDLWKVWWKPAIRYELQYDEESRPIMIPDPDQPGKEKQAVKTTYLWPSKWNDATLADKRIELGERVFARQYLLKAMSDDERVFPETSLERSYCRELAYIGEGIEPDWPTFGGLDLASSLGKRAAWTVLVTLAKNPVNGKLRIKSILRKKMGFSKTIDHLTAEWSEHHWSVLYVESNQYQTAVIDALDTNHKHIPVQAFRTGVNKNDEMVGLPGMNVAFGKGLFEIPAARFPLAPEDTSDLGVLMTELQSYPGGESKDVIMALWFAYRASVENSGDFEESYIQAIMIA